MCLPLHPSLVYSHCCHTVLLPSRQNNNNVTQQQGDEDEIVPPSQSELMWRALRDKGLPTTLMMYKVSVHVVKPLCACCALLSAV